MLTSSWQNPRKKPKGINQVINISKEKEERRNGKIPGKGKNRCEIHHLKWGKVMDQAIAMSVSVQKERIQMCPD